MNPYEKFASEFSRLVREGKSLPLGGFEPIPARAIAPNSPKALFFAPHPDDECISGGIALRIMREAGMSVLNVAVTQGSKKERQAERLKELQAACKYIGFGLITTGPTGLEKIDPRTREQDPAHWAACVSVILNIRKEQQPRIIMFPHDRDWNSSHIGTHLLVIDALKQMPAEFACFLVETEFWGQMSDPHLTVVLSERDLTDLITATSFHIGEVKRNPYHLLMPAWMMDNVRRGSELVGGQGGTAPDFTFATLYRLRKWSDGSVEKVLDAGKQISASTNISQLFT